MTYNKDKFRKFLKFIISSPFLIILQLISKSFLTQVYKELNESIKIYGSYPSNFQLNQIFYSSTFYHNCLNESPNLDSFLQLNFN